MQATTPLDPRVLDVMMPWMLQRYGNPHSRTHSYGWEAEAAVEVARAQVASLIGASPREVSAAILLDYTYTIVQWLALVCMSGICRCCCNRSVDSQVLLQLKYAVSQNLACNLQLEYCAFWLSAVRSSVHLDCSSI
jgi:Aminotransferase class-V